MSCRCRVMAVTGKEAGDARWHSLKVVVGVLVAERHARQPQPPQVAQHRVRRLHLVQQVRVEAQVTVEGMLMRYVWLLVLFRNMTN